MTKGQVSAPQNDRTRRQAEDGDRAPYHSPPTRHKEPLGPIAYNLSCASNVGEALPKSAARCMSSPSPRTFHLVARGWLASIDAPNGQGSLAQAAVRAVAAPGQDLCLPLNGDGGKEEKRQRRRRVAHGSCCATASTSVQLDLSIHPSPVPPCYAMPRKWRCPRRGVRVVRPFHLGNTRKVYTVHHPNQSYTTHSILLSRPCGSVGRDAAVASECAEAMRLHAMRTPAQCSPSSPSLSTATDIVARPEVPTISSTRPSEQSSISPWPSPPSPSRTWPPAPSAVEEERARSARTPC